MQRATFSYDDGSVRVFGNILAVEIDTGDEIYGNEATLTQIYKGSVDDTIKVRGWETVELEAAEYDAQDDGTPEVRA